ncbi:DJ-1/PfpI family protein [Streptomyces sp. NPDC002838]|uniref:DJ-1/PfpI family protein n=1 Tax=Streptomyces sp. NPDC002838 TaxID=3154436 RepID=UPI003326CBE1
MLLSVLAYDGVDDLDLFGAYSVLCKGADAAAGRAPAVSVRITAADRAVTTSAGVRITAEDDLATLVSSDAAVVPGGRGAVAAAGTEQVLAALRDAHARGCRLYAVCSGTLLIAAAGLAKERALAVHHAKADQLRAAGAREVSAGLVRSDGICSVGGDRSPSVKSVDAAFAVLADLLPDTVHAVCSRMELIPGRRATARLVP